MSDVCWASHYNDVIMTKIASQITSLTVVYSIVYSEADQRKHQSSASLAFVWGIHRDRWIPRTKGQLRGKCFHLMTSSWMSSGTSWVCNIYARSFAPWAILSIMAMMSRPVLNDFFKTWSMITALTPVNHILISSQSLHSSPPNLHALNYWLAYTLINTHLLMVL